MCAVRAGGVGHAWLSGRGTAPECSEHRCHGPSAAALASSGQGWGHRRSCHLLLLHGQAGSTFPCKRPAPSCPFGSHAPRHA